MATTGGETVVVDVDVDVEVVVGVDVEVDVDVVLAGGWPGAGVQPAANAKATTATRHGFI
ncbi:MAG: hypothetical protein IPG03_14080 [Candidatus Microthrix sp.]|nr:hypothetical protein [Candidatus Microthrix sp.]MBK6503427.1 hypothetical protein [Candidatus Microthrix sp.]